MKSFGFCHFNSLGYSRGDGYSVRGQNDQALEICKIWLGWGQRNEWNNSWRTHWPHFLTNWVSRQVSLANIRTSLFWRHQGDNHSMEGSQSLNHSLTSLGFFEWLEGPWWCNLGPLAPLNRPFVALIRGWRHNKTLEAVSRGRPEGRSEPLYQRICSRTSNTDYLLLAKWSWVRLWFCDI